MSPHDARHAADPEYRPGRAGRIASWHVIRDGKQTIAATGDYAMSVAIGAEATRLARENFRKRRGS